MNPAVARHNMCAVFIAQINHYNYVVVIVVVVVIGCQTTVSHFRSIYNYTANITCMYYVLFSNVIICNRLAWLGCSTLIIVNHAKLRLS